MTQPQYRVTVDPTVAQIARPAVNEQIAMQIASSVAHKFSQSDVDLLDPAHPQHRVSKSRYGCAAMNSSCLHCASESLFVCATPTFSLRIVCRPLWRARQFIRCVFLLYLQSCKRDQSASFSIAVNVCGKTDKSQDPAAASGAVFKADPRNVQFQYGRATPRPRRRGAVSEGSCVVHCTSLKFFFTDLGKKRFKKRVANPRQVWLPGFMHCLCHSEAYRFFSRQAPRK